MPINSMTTHGVHTTSNSAYGLIAVAGPDALTFLQGQLTQDVRDLNHHELKLAAYQSPQGRVLTTIRLFATPDAVMLILARAMAEEIATRLKRYTLRAKVSVTDVSDDYHFYCAVNDARSPAYSGAQVMTQHDQHQLDWGHGRVMTISQQPDIRLASHSDEAAWFTACILAADSHIEPQTSDQFTAHMLNLDLLGAISFTKGCYTGQEIVARTEHRGRVKRRLFAYQVETATAELPLLSGVFLGEDKVGEIVNSNLWRESLHCLAVVNLPARDQPLRAESGAILTPCAVPYPVPEPSSEPG